MHIRNLTEDDLDAFWELRLRALRDNPEAYGSTYEETIARGKTQMLQRMVPTERSFILGVFDEQLVGMARFHAEDYLKERHRGFVFSVYVVPEKRGQGTGKALMEELIAQAKQVEGLEQLNLAVVTTNEPAIRLYLSLGFEIYGTAPHALKQDGRYWDEHLMVLHLV